MIRRVLASVLLLGAVFALTPAQASDCPPYIPEVIQPALPFC